MSLRPEPFALVFVLALVGASACGSCERPPGGATESDTAEAEPTLPTGVVEGVIRLAEGAELPSYTPEEIGDEGEGRTRPESCPPPRKTERQPVEVSEDGGLSGVLLSATGFSKSPPHTPVEHTVTIRECRLDPPLVAATRGDTLRMENEMEHPFLPILGGDSFMRALLRGQSRIVELPRGGVQRLACSFGAPCGRSDVVVLYHPVHATTAEDGTFRLEGVPADEDVKIHAWHPLFEEASAEVKVGRGETTKLELVLKPALRRPKRETSAGASDEDGANDGKKADRNVPELL